MNVPTANSEVRVSLDLIPAHIPTCWGLQTYSVVKMPPIQPHFLPSRAFTVLHPYFTLSVNGKGTESSCTVCQCSIFEGRTEYLRVGDTMAIVSSFSRSV